MSKSENKRIIDDYYVNALSELHAGCLIEDMEEVLYYYEEEERYLECEGVKRAIHDFKYLVFFKDINKKHNS